MTENINQTNIAAKDRGKRKILFPAVAVLCVLTVLSVLFLIFKNDLWFALAEKKAENNDFYSAHSVICRSTDERGSYLRQYISLRIEINRKYPKMISDFDESTLNEWREAAEQTVGNADLFSDEIADSARLLTQKLEMICGLYDEYKEFGDDIYGLMDIFSELNRLYEKSDDGKNNPFTVREELEKVDAWEQTNTALSEYACRIPGYGDCYLLNYLIKEVQGECSDIRAAMDKVLSGGYSETDRVRLGGEGRKVFPDIQSGISDFANVLRKDEYIKYMDSGVCRVLMQSLAEFYTVGLGE